MSSTPDTEVETTETDGSTTNPDPPATDSTTASLDGRNHASTAGATTTTGPTPPIVALDDVDFGYTSTPVVEDVSLDVHPGEYVAIVGPNGSGKSTLMKLVLGLLRPDDGVARLFEEPAHEFEDGTRVGYVAQHASASKDMPITVREVVKMGRIPHVGFNFLSSEDWEIVDNALETVGMAEFADRRVTELSGGQRQRAFIARALASQAELLVLDEPTVGVDAESVDAFYDLLESLNRDGITILLIEHDLRAVTEHAERIVCLNREVHFDGPTSEFVEGDALARAFGTAANVVGDGT